MEKEESKETYWITCLECQGRGKKKRRMSKKVRLQYQMELDQFEKMKSEGKTSLRPNAHHYSCTNCKGSGLIRSALAPLADVVNYPHIAIIGAGIGGVALAVACLHRGIPYTLYERDSDFHTRSQGYGLTLQQASKAIEGLGIFSLKEGIISTRHLAHTIGGKVIGEWGMRKYMRHEQKTPPKRKNIHIARQALRLSLLEQLGGSVQVKWGHQLVDFKETDIDGIELNFLVAGEIKSANADLLVGADGIRSTVRKLLIGDNKTPLRYLDCIVILGICPLADLENLNSPLLDSATVFQTANGNERIYMMPYSSDAVMWQLSFPMTEKEAKCLSNKGSQALKKEACHRTQWHHPIPQILDATPEDKISGYPVYDRALLPQELLEKGKKTTLIGDAAHPMSPFKGQGANQAILDALALARGIQNGCGPGSKWKDVGIRKSILTDFENEMLERSASKVKDSADAAQFLHSDVVLYERDGPRGLHLRKKS